MFIRYCSGIKHRLKKLSIVSSIPNEIHLRNNYHQIKELRAFQFVNNKKGYPIDGNDVALSKVKKKKKKIWSAGTRLDYTRLSDNLDKNVFVGIIESWRQKIIN